MKFKKISQLLGGRMDNDKTYTFEFSFHMINPYAACATKLTSYQISQDIYMQPIIQLSFYIEYLEK